MNRLPLDQILKIVKEKLSPRRLAHSIAVAETSAKLASQVGISIKKVQIAALLHDYAKGFEEKKLRKIIKKSGWEIDSFELKLIQLLHAPVSAFLAKDEFGIEDKEILEAIRFHTIGHPDMGLLALILYISDYIEPNRNYPGVEEARRRAVEGITPAIIFITGQSIKYNIDRGRLIHPNTLLLRNAYLRRMT